MEIIKTIDLWTEQHNNHYECFNGAFVDGFENSKTPFDKYKIIKNCNCIITVNSPDINISNKHNAIIFYKDRVPVRLVVINKDTDIDKCVKVALEQHFENSILKDYYVKYNIKSFIVDMKEEQICKVTDNTKVETDVGKYIDRIELANSLNINTPKVYNCDNSTLCDIVLNDTKFRLCVFQYIDGKSFYDLNEIPTQAEIKNIIEQMAHIHNAKLESDFIYDKWTITNFVKEYEEKGKYLDNKYNKIFESLVHKITNVKFEKLPTCFVHGDIISSNVMKDSRHKLWIIDFAVSNYLPRIVDLAVTSCNLCLNPESIDKTIESTKMILAEYQKYNKLTDYELECFPLFYDLANAMGILQISYLNSLGETSEEDAFWLSESEKGLSFSTPDFWEIII